MGTRGPLKLPAHLRPVPGQKPPADGDVDAPVTAADVVKPGRPPRPEKLPKALHELWDQLVDDLDAAGMLAAVDGPALELALRHYAAAVKASNTLAAGSITVADPVHGGRKKNPAEAVFRAQSAAFLAYAQQLGMTFVSRARSPMSREDPAGGEATNPFAASG